MKAKSKAAKKVARQKAPARRKAKRKVAAAKARRAGSKAKAPAARRRVGAKKSPAQRRGVGRAKAATREVRGSARPIATPAAGAPAAAALTLPEALKIAIGFERKVRDHYGRGAAAISDPQGSKVFATLAREEQSHVDYLESRLAEWSATGTLGAGKLPSILPTPEWVRKAEARHRETASLRRVADQNELELLKTALRLEHESSTFYHDLVQRLPDADRGLFEQFLTIEDGHLTIVQAELDAVLGWGYWFDVQEFALEAQ